MSTSNTPQLSNMQVTLVWTDPPADPSAARALVNDLDLTVNADSLNGNGLHGNGAKDYVNNAEQVNELHIRSSLRACSMHLPARDIAHCLQSRTAMLMLSTCS